jgi:hypothetical protein
VKKKQVLQKINTVVKETYTAVRWSTSEIDKCPALREAVV